jgi:hypothetical protein
MEDDDMAIVDEEGTCRRKITRVKAGEGVVEELIRAGGIVKWRNLEDQWKETTMGRPGGVAGRGGNTRRFRRVGGVERRHRVSIR